MILGAVLETATYGIEAQSSAVRHFAYWGKKTEPLEFKLRRLSLVPASFGRFSSASGGNIMCGSYVSKTREWVVTAKIFGHQTSKFL